jgi:hypothetical protein
LIAQLPSELSTMEGADVFRRLGEWNALQGRWAAAKERFHLLQRVTRANLPMIASIDWIRSAVAIIESNNRNQYESFCEESLKAFGDIADPVMSERLVKNCLLEPPSQALTDALQAPAQRLGKSLEKVDFTKAVTGWEVPWRCLSLALWEYRAGHFANAIEWCRRCIAGGDLPPVRPACARVILAMALKQAGEIDRARAEFERAREIIEQKFQKPLDAGDGNTGAWYDWVFSRILLREAAALIDPGIGEGTSVP